jgi:hypothetical protein
VAPRQVLYLSGINASQREAWRKTIEVRDADVRRQVALFPAVAVSNAVQEAAEGGCCRRCLRSSLRSSAGSPRA